MSDFKQERVLITGSAGSIGSALARKIAELKPRAIFLLDNNESGLFELQQELKNVVPIIASIRDEENLGDIFKKYRPSLVFHCAAYKHVPLMEEHPLEALKTNIGGTFNLIHEAIVNGVERFIFISTDKAVKPNSIMGQTKKLCERMCKIANTFSKTRFIVVRFGNVMASRGSVVSIFQKQITENRPLTITDAKMRRYFMGIYDAVELILVAAESRSGDMFLLDMGEPKYVVDIAKEMLALSGKNLPIKFIGARKGEVLFERLHDPDHEKTKKKGKRLIEIL